MSYAVRDIVVNAKELEKKGKKIYWLNIGDPLKFDFRTPPHLWKAVLEKRKEAESYALAEGIPEARNAIAEYYSKKGIPTNPEQVVIGNGLSEIIWFLMGVTANPGEEILLPKPTYPLYVSACHYLGVKPKFYELSEENNWQPNCSDLRKKINEKTKALVIINPNNPTGGNYSKKILQKIADIASEHKLTVLADETYEMQLLTEKKHHLFGSLSEDIPVFSMNSLSKNFFATGFRVGWTAANDYLTENSNLLDALKKMARGRLCAEHPFQYTVKPALEGSRDFLKENLQKIKKRQEFTHKRLNEINGISCVKPEAAFYAFPRIDLGIESDKEFVLNLLKETSVCVVFGEGFKQKEGTHHFRVVALPRVKVLREAFNRLEKFIQKNYS